jgi:hypothetical protein
MALLEMDWRDGALRQADAEAGLKAALLAVARGHRAFYRDQHFGAFAHA